MPVKSGGRVSLRNVPVSLSLQDKQHSATWGRCIQCPAPIPSLLTPVPGGWLATISTCISFPEGFLSSQSPLCPSAAGKSRLTYSNHGTLQITIPFSPPSPRDVKKHLPAPHCPVPARLKVWLQGPVVCMRGGGWGRRRVDGKEGGSWLSPDSSLTLILVLGEDCPLQADCSLLSYNLCPLCELPHLWSGISYPKYWILRCMHLCITWALLEALQSGSILIDPQLIASYLILLTHMPLCPWWRDPNMHAGTIFVHLVRPSSGCVGSSESLFLPLQEPGASGGRLYNYFPWSSHCAALLLSNHEAKVSNPLLANNRGIICKSCVCS